MNCNWACWFAVILFLPLYIGHLWVMIGPLHWWCDGNMILMSYSLYTLGQMFIAYLYALESPLWLRLTKEMRWVPTIFAIISAAVWLISCIVLAIKVIINGDIWKEFEDVIQAYLIVVGLPHAVYSIYNFAMH